MAVGDKYPVLMASQLGMPNGPAGLNDDALLPILQGGVEAGNPQLALANLGAGVRPNGVLNPLAVINQIGQTSYSNPSGGTRYAFDGRKGRFYEVSLVDGVEDIQISGVASGTARYGAVVPSGLKSGRKYTATILIMCETVVGEPYFMVSNNLSSIASIVTLTKGDDYTAVSVTFTASSNMDAVLLEIAAANGSSLSAKVNGWKIEDEEGQTLAYKDSTGAWKLLPQPENSYSNELLNCRRYGESIIGGRAHGVATSESFVAVTYPFFAEKRAIPVLNTDKINLEKILFDNTAGTLVTPTAVSLRGPRKGGAVLGFTGAFTVGHEYSLFSDTSGGYFDANL